MANATVRAATEHDVAAINDLYNHEIRGGVATWDETPWTIQQRHVWFQEHQQGQQPVLVAVNIHGDVVGFASLTRYSALSGYRYTRENTIIVAPECQGQRIGTLLLSALVDEGRRIGLRLIVASVTTTNESSLALHRKLGYRDMGILPNAGFKFGRWLSTVYLHLDLAAIDHRPSD